MNYEYEIQNLKNQISDLQDTVRKIAKGNTEEVSKREQTTVQVDSLTPYTETQIGYYGETEKTFYNVPQGNVTVFGLKEYDLDRISDRLTITFDALSEQTEITISIL